MLIKWSGSYSFLLTWFCLLRQHFCRVETPEYLRAKAALLRRSVLITIDGHPRHQRCLGGFQVGTGGICAVCSRRSSPSAGFVMIMGQRAMSISARKS